MSAFAWPSAVVLLGVIVIAVFRAPLVRFLDRTKSISKSGLHAYDDAQLAGANQQQVTPAKPDALTEFLEGFHSPLLLEIENTIEEEIKTRGLATPADIHKALRKSLAVTIIQWQFERLDNFIWGSQTAVLHYLNPKVKPEHRTDIEPFYTTAAEAYPKLYANYSFDEWLSFLANQMLILKDGSDAVMITVRGREYLKWRIENGRSGPYYG